MTGFWVMAAGMVALALAFVLFPLIRPRAAAEGAAPRLLANVRIHRDQLRQLQADRERGALSADAFEAEQAELGKRVLEDALAALDEETPQVTRSGSRWAAATLAPVVSAATGVDSVKRDSPHGMSFDQIRTSADALATRLQSQPNDGDGWATLARSYNVLGRFDEAAAAFERAVAQLPDDAQLLADYADALAMSQGQRLEGKPLDVIARALKADPGNLKALALAGTAAFERKDYRQAVGYWEKVVQTAPADSEFGRSIGGSLDEARAFLGGKTPVAALPTIMPAVQPAIGGGGSIRGTVSVAPALASRLKPDDTVFIFARAENGPRMPLAILSKPFRELPTSFTLDDSSAMLPDRKLSTAGAVRVVARVSRSGNATAQSGDLEGSVGPLKPGAAGVQLNIDGVVP
jgi:cytochrome c-type biogenesis protein CcmH